MRRGDDALWLEQLDQLTGDTARVRLDADRVWLRAECDFLTEEARFSYSTDGTAFTTLGPPFGMIFQLKTFQGVRYALFAYNARGAAGGWADFDAMRVDEPHPHGLTRPIPVGRTIALRVESRGTRFAIGGEERFAVVDRGLGRVALRTGERFLSVTPLTDSTSAVSLRTGEPGEGETFQWIESFYGDVALMSLATHRYLRVEADGRVTSDSPGLEGDPDEGTALGWRIVPDR